MNIPAIIFAILATATLVALYLFQNRKFAQIKARGLSATEAELEAMPAPELRILQDVLGAGYDSASDQARERIRLIDQLYRKKRETTLVAHYLPGDH
ncbi:hypothetical protein [Arthrobacter sp. A2-55]|uniref:hypothetical protein n=1 Tax=Arthrobacter sp. A2-55 TaxID=2897337 RepID=UPI0021CD3866|nr:hypothetical protein [Arthrobacter sp. A2-55]MCU6479073.1 hypothetical protein [Arthrobacter sp. A2-55]